MSGFGIPAEELDPRDLWVDPNSPRFESARQAAIAWLKTNSTWFGKGTEMSLARAMYDHAMYDHAEFVAIDKGPPTPTAPVQGEGAWENMHTFLAEKIEAGRIMARHPSSIADDILAAGYRLPQPIDREKLAWFLIRRDQEKDKAAGENGYSDDWYVGHGFVREFLEDADALIAHLSGDDGRKGS